MNRQLYNINFASGRLEPISNEGKNDLLPGRILQLEGYDNPRYVITENLGISENFRNYSARYRVINLKTLMPAQKNAYELMFISEKNSGRIQTYILDESIPIAEVEAIIEKSKQAIIDAENAKKEAAEKRAAAIAALPAKYPYLTPGDKPAKNIRIELKREFPKIKFSVKTERGNIGISWDDGPTIEQVAKITGKYQEGHFNGMEDIYERDHDNIFCEVFGGARYVSEYRHESPELIIKAAKEELGIDIPSGESDNYGNLPGLDRNKSLFVYRKARTMAG